MIAMNRVLKWIDAHHHWVSILFFVAFFIVGIFIFDDYGIPIDDPAQKILGEYTYDYVFNGNQDLFGYMDQHYGSAIVLLSTIVYRAFHFEDDIHIYLIQHLMIFIWFFLGVLAFYSLCLKISRNWKIALLGSLLLVASPRIFENAFYNTKDIPVLCFFIFSMYTLIRLDENPGFGRACMHALTTGLLIAIRPVGLLIIGLTLLDFILMRLYCKFDLSISKKRFNLISLSYIALSLVFVISFWPWLWPDPLNHLLYSLGMMAQSSGWDRVNLYIGEYIRKAEIPWHFIPVWIAITTPLMVLFTFFIGLIKAIHDLLKARFNFSTSDARNKLMIVLWFFLPLCAVMVFRTVVYNGWRHMFFIYPALVILSIYGIVWMFENIRLHFKSKLIRAVFPVSLIISLIGTAATMMINHPYESMYFNLLAGKNMRSVKYRYDLDYWGLCYRDALEFVLEQDDDLLIPIYSYTVSGQRNAFLIPYPDRGRIKWVYTMNEAKYFVGSYQEHRDNFPLADEFKEFYAIKVGGVNLCVVYKFHD